jgi:hypothetical protein
MQMGMNMKKSLNLANQLKLKIHANQVWECILTRLRILTYQN